MKEESTMIKGLLSEDWRKLQLAVIDFETTGLDSTKDRIVEYGIAYFDNGKFINVRSNLVNPEMKLSEEVIKIHGITNEELEKADTFFQQYWMIEDFLTGRIPVAYNASFDRAFFHAEINRLCKHANFYSPSYVDLPAFWCETWIDPLVWIRHFFKYEKSKKLTSICKKLDIKLENAHRAASDAEAAGKVLFALQNKLPFTYGELISKQTRLAEEQERDYQNWKQRQKKEIQK